MDGALAEVRGGDVEVGANLVRRALGQRHPLVEHVDPVAHVHDQSHVVVDQQHARAVLVADRADDRRERGHLRLGKPRRRLVHQHEARLGRERARHAEPPLVALRERRRRRVGVGGEAEQVQQLAGALRRTARRDADAERRHLHVLADGQRAERAAVLERAREPVPAAAVRRPARDVASLQLDRAGGRPVEAAEQIDERRLARSVRPDQTDDLTPPELERDVAERLHALEQTGDRGGPECSSGPPLQLLVDRCGQPEIFGTTFATTVATR